MWTKVVLCLTTLRLYGTLIKSLWTLKFKQNSSYCIMECYVLGIAAQGECTDLRGRLISHGLHYVPGPDTCTLCVCDNGLPKVCKAVLCSPPQVGLIFK